MKKEDKKTNKVFFIPVVISDRGITAETKVKRVNLLVGSTYDKYRNKIVIAV
jgi:hypothetical protein